MILPAWLHHLAEGFSYKEVQFKLFCLPVKTSCPSAENINETHAPASQPSSANYFYLIVPFTTDEKYYPY